MKIRLALFALILTALGFANPTKAQEQASATNIALASELVGIMHPELSAPSNRIKQIQSQMDATTNSSPAVKAMMQNALGLSTESNGYLDKMKSAYVSLYASKFTTEELQGVLAFYKTPIGQKWGEKQTEITMEFASKSMAMMPGIMDAAKKAMAGFTNPPVVPVPAPTDSPAN